MELTVANCRSAVVQGLYVESSSLPFFKNHVSKMLGN